MMRSAIMAIDITNYRIGIALAYHKQQTSAGREEDDTIVTTSITALPPIPYISSKPYHPSYAFLHHHRPENLEMIRSLDREERTLEVADQLAQLAIDRKVKGVLVRWPGDLASAVCGGNGNESKVEEVSRQIEDGQLLLPNISSTDSNGAGNTNQNSDGSMGYMRGRIIYMLDKCCSSYGHAKTNNTSSVEEPLITEGSRPFCLWDTSLSEQNWISYDEQENSRSNKQYVHHPRILQRQDKYGNSLTEMDDFGRAAVFGNQPPDPQRGKHHYSSKQLYSGYRVSTLFGANIDGKGSSMSDPLHNDSFDRLDDNNSRMKIFQGSLSAMHALYDFTTENLPGQVILPTWASSSSMSRKAKSGQGRQLFDEGSFEHRHNQSGDDMGSVSVSSLVSDLDDTASSGTTKSNLRVGTVISSPTSSKATNGLTSLVQMPKRKTRRRERRG